ncbi:alpha/beta fold hydrolase [Pelagibacterium luteolum]|uniref:Pimeloyl-ACP methyl ester carboxylesterase n=1 Tax=Pelagibacterium luteolum TaxID=440168 RepID=A0A1G7TE27_9HYPH|nr:alpha/beta hydrolase [Pelagibacterium luteolum]SDG32810.1 Pimeloyl-ACP methyl ester carboxylesterase [Pelagibacterium luteolum]
MSSHLRIVSLLGAALCACTAPSFAQEGGITNVVLVHGAWADGSGWREIYDILTDQGYAVSIVQNPLTSLADDVAATDRVLDRQDGPAILVGHSYGGAVISEAGDHDNVAGLVYVEAFVPDAGESVFGLIPQQEGVEPPFEFTEDGFVFFSADAFVPGFADSVDPELAEFMRDSQVPIAFEEAGNATLSVAAWHDKPSWYQLANADHVIPPEIQRQMAERAGATLVEISGGHLAFMADPQATADLIIEAASGATP